MAREKKAVHVQYSHNHHRPNDIVHVNNDVTFLSTIFDPWLVEYVDVEPTDTEGQLYCHCQFFSLMFALERTLEDF